MCIHYPYPIPLRLPLTSRLLPTIECVKVRAVGAKRDNLHRSTGRLLRIVLIAAIPIITLSSSSSYFIK